MAYSNRSRMGQMMVMVLAIVAWVAIPAWGQSADFSVVVALGDSLTDTPAERGPNHAEHITEQLGVPLQNFAVIGATSQSLLDGHQHTDAIDSGATFAFLWIGGNDMLNNFINLLADDDAFVDTAIANWGITADALLDSGATVITANLPDLSRLPVASIDGAEFLLPYVQEAALLYNERLQMAADERGIPVVDVYALFNGLFDSDPTICGVAVGVPPSAGGDTDLFYDEIHPTSFGMGLVTNAFIDVMNAEFGTSLEHLTTTELGALAGVDCEGAEVDSDNDGIVDLSDNCPLDPNANQEDFDRDGVGDACDGCPLDPAKLEPGECGCGLVDIDTDLDGTLDCNDECPNDPFKTEAGFCGCGEVELDSDTDGMPDCVDECPTDADKVEPGVCGCDVPDVDTDADGVLDCLDNCPNSPNPDQADADGDDVGDVCDSDSSGDDGSSGDGSNQNTNDSGGGTASTFCGGGTAGMIPLMLLGLWGLRLTRERR
jgi:phospholipase/lecithinase/hemolysin